jgi:hypothetical protein
MSAPIASSPIDEVAGQLRAVLAGIDESDGNRHFLAAYLRTTLAVGAAVRQGLFVDPRWVERWDAAFARFYIRAIETYRRGESPAEPWKVAFEAAHSTDLPPVRHVLLGINAHVNFDLPQALLAVMTDDDFADPTVRALRARDHEAIDEVLASRVSAEDAELESVSGGRSLVDQLLGPLNRAATRRFLKEAREKVWANALLLSNARRAGQVQLQHGVGRLAALSAAKVSQLMTARQVLLRLSISGFGVRLEEG